MKRKALFILFMLISLQIFGHSDDTVYLLTLPKAGTHCLEKYFKLLASSKKPLPHFRRSHLSESYLHVPKDYFLNPNVKKIVLVRDLRDTFLSAFNWVETRKHWMHARVGFNPGWGDLSMEEKVLELVDYNKVPEYLVWHYKDRHLPQQYKKMADKARGYLGLPNVLFVQYEKLSGCHGERVQLETMQEINDFLNISVSDEEYSFVQKNLFGNSLIPTLTFREGGMNKWKSSMSESLQEQIWNLYGDAILDFGYEK